MNDGSLGTSGPALSQGVAILSRLGHFCLSLVIPKTSLNETT